MQIQRPSLTALAFTILISIAGSASATSLVGEKAATREETFICADPEYTEHDQPLSDPDRKSALPPAAVS